MKRLTPIFFLIPVIFSVPASAEELCQEEAKAAGYIGPIEMLAPCKPKKNAAPEVQSKESRKKLEDDDLAKKQHDDSFEQLGQAQTQ